MIGAKKSDRAWIFKANKIHKSLSKKRIRLLFPKKFGLESSSSNFLFLRIEGTSNSLRGFTSYSLLEETWNW